MTEIKTFEEVLNDTKICSMCKIDKPKSDYHKLNTKSCGIQTKCKECTSKYKKERYWRNHEAELAKMTKSRLKPENIEQRRGYYKERKGEYRKRYLKYVSDEKCIQRIKKSSKDTYQKNKEQVRARHRKNSQKEEVKARVRERHNQRKSTDLEYVITRRLRFRLRHIFKRLGSDNYKALSTMNLLGCEMPFFKEYIESKFVDGMNWDRISEIHLDHIKPCASFDLTNPDEQKKCFHYTNVQPLWYEDNLSKGAKYEGENYRKCKKQ